MIDSALDTAGQPKSEAPTAEQALSPLPLAAPEAGAFSPTESDESRETSDEKGALVPSPATRPPSPERRLTPKEIQKGAQRLQFYKAAAPLIQSGLTFAQAAALVGTSAPNLHRIYTEYHNQLDCDLSPEACAPAYNRQGHPSIYQPLAENPQVAQRLHQLYLLSVGASCDASARGRRTGSAQATLKIFTLDPLCPPSLARLIRMGKAPQCLVNVIRRLNDLHEQRHRGEKHLSLNATLIHRREPVEILADHTRREVHLGDWWVFDDMSANLPHWWRGDDGQYYLGRQGLYSYDRGGMDHPHWIAVEKVGTPRDAYTAAIVLRHFRHVCETFGIPRRGFVLERGVWESNAIRGFKTTPDGDIEETETQLQAIPETDKALIRQGIEALGIQIHYTHTPRGKEIEGAFNYLQRLTPMMAGQIGINIGRHAGEFEHAAKQMRRVRAASHTPEDLGFLHIDAALALELKVMDFINAEPHMRQDGVQRPAPPYPQGRPLSDRDRAVFLPLARPLEIRGGNVTATVDGQPYDFTHPEVFASLGSGYRLLVKFDPAEPHIGAAIYNNESSSANFNRYQIGEFICWADFHTLVPRFNWTEGSYDDPAALLKQRFNKAVRTAYGAAGLNHRIATAHDGRGATATVETRNQKAESRNAEPRPAEPRFRRNTCPEAANDPILRELLQELDT